ncbi:hypothetical protein AADZ91_01825 [Colwelliaceae bacterium 6441]
MRTVVAHGHIFKNAGSSLDWAFERNFGNGFCDHRDDIPMRREGGEYLENYLVKNPKIKAISSHHMCDLSGIKNINIIPLYLIRHPIERIRSVYSFERKQKVDTPGAIAAKKYSFVDYVKWRMQPEVNATIRDYQTIYLSGCQTRRPELIVNEDIISRAMKNLKNSNCVGIVDKYDESMVVFEEYLKTSFPDIDLSYIRQNVTDKSSSDVDNKRLEVVQELLPIIGKVFENNSADMFLYTQANFYLDERIRQIEDFSEKLDKFKLRCAQL